MKVEEHGSESVREQLIVAGIVELEAHGIADFSLRRVASACNLSCAAPYKHFKDKDEFIKAIFTYINSQLHLLLEQVAVVFHDNPKRHLIESCVAYIRFCLANPHFRAVLTLSENTLPLADTVNALLPACSSASDAETLENHGMALRALTYGAVLLLESKELPNTEQSMQRIRKQLERELLN